MDRGVGHLPLKLIGGLKLNRRGRLMRSSRKFDRAFVAIDSSAHPVSLHGNVTSGECNVPTWLRMGPDCELVLPESESDRDWVGLARSQPAGHVIPILSEPGNSVNFSVRCGDDLDVPSSRNIGGRN